MKSIRITALVVFTLLSCLPFAFGSTDTWVLQKNKNGITVYTRLLKGTSLNEVRVVNKVRSSLSAIVALFFDTKNSPKWQYGCGSAKNLLTINEQEVYNYQVTELPWPLSDRDVVAHFKVSQNPVTGVVTFLKTGMPDYIPEQDGLVRVRNFRSEYTLTPIGTDSVLMELQIHLDPGGKVPPWFYNENCVTGPYNTTVALIKLLPDYQSHTYSFIKEK